MNRQIILKSRPAGEPTKENFEFQEIKAPNLNEGEILVKARYISVDPYMRGRMNDADSYIPPFEVGSPIEGGVVAEVIESRHVDFKVGEYVTGIMAWKEIQVIPAQKINKIDKNIAPLGYYLGILGMPGLTAYFGLLDIGQPQKGETVVISGAAGAVGTIVGQIARIKGCKVVGIAGSDEKINYLKNELHFDEVINYRTTKNINEAIGKACPEGIDIYFDNVGGEISDVVMNHIKKHARIAVCGQISLYNSTELPTGPRIQVSLLKKSVLMKGFIVSDYADKFNEGIQQLAQWVSEGKLSYRQTIEKGFEKLPDAFMGLFKGKNIGKYLIEIQ